MEGLKQRAREVALDAGHRAAALLQEGFRRDLTVELKGEVDLVTEYDRRAEELIVGILREQFCDHRIEGEETGTAQKAARDAPVWYIDPLDGTTNFAHHLPWYAISMGLEVAGEIEVGVIIAPELGWTASAIRDSGATLNKKPISVSSTRDPKRALFATGFPYDRQRYDNTAAVGRVIRAARGLRRMGSAALDCLAVACGWLDGYWELDIRPWDVAAGSLLVKEAGGHVSDLQGGPFTAQRGEILTTNGPLHEPLVALVKGES
jgi:myo-inositol-1(or 4)-monophosphatase